MTIVLLRALSRGQPVGFAFTLSSALRTYTGLVILVVFGAGASYDAVPAYPPSGRGAPVARLPLSNDLFDIGFWQYLQNLPRVEAVVPRLRDLVPGESLEEILEKLSAQSVHDPERVRQLMGVRYYIHSMISKVGADWYGASGGSTNHRVVLDELRRLVSAEVPIALVTFNYDLLIEQALMGLREPVAGLESYIEGRFRLYKMHGSADWAQTVDSGSVPSGLRKRALSNHVIENAPDVRLTRQFRRIIEVPLGQNPNLPEVPAIAIPLQRKQDFVLPDSHLASLRESLPQVTHIITIGWRAADEPFLDLLSSVPDLTPGVVVTQSKPDEVIGRISNAGLRFDLVPIKGGFTQFSRSWEIEALLKKRPAGGQNRRG